MNRLFVPITLNVFVTSRNKLREKYIASVNVNFADLDFTTIGGNIEPQPFDTLAPLGCGAHLHFILPDGLTREQDGKYPPIPNRWMVIRIVDGEKPTVRAWIVQSDYVGEYHSGSTTVPAYAGGDLYKSLGRCYPVQTPPEMLSATPYELTVMGWGDPAFAACYLNCMGVLGFHDSLSDVQEGEISYAVYGWYSEGEKDPLNKATEENWGALLDSLGFSVPEGTPPKTETVCHGMIHGLGWRGPAPAEEYPPGKPSGSVDVAMGNSSVEALAALTAKAYAKRFGLDSAESLERFVAAVQLELLEELEAVDGLFKLQDAIHKNGFTAIDGGFLWSVREEDGTEGKKASLPGGIGELLGELNRAQDDREMLQRRRFSQILSMQEAWYQYMLLYEDSDENKTSAPSIEQFREEIYRLKALIDEIDAAAQPLDESIAKMTAELEELIKGKPFRLEKEQKERFFYPNNPVMMLAGKGVGRSFLFGQDGVLPCRNTLVSGLGNQSGRLSRDEVLAYCGELPACKEANFADFVCETLCLSPQLVKTIENATGQKQLRPQGELPDSIATRQWQQPEDTLFSEWMLDYYTTKTPSPNDDTIANWRLSDIDYQYTKHLPSSWFRYNGRTFITPHSVLLLEQSVKKYAERYADDPAMLEKLSKISKHIGGLSVLSQEIGDFSNLLLSKGRSLELPRIGGQGGDDISRLVEKYVGNTESFSVWPNHPFHPLRGGFGQLMRLNIIGTYGQITTLVSEKEVYTPVMSEQYRPEPENNAPHHAVLRPRLSQPSRLRFRWNSVKNEATESNRDSDTTPVCGYLIPNLLNRGLMVYEADGVFKGTLKLTYKGGKTRARWVSSPKEKMLPFDKEEFSNEHLRGFLQRILDCDAKGNEAFLELLHIIDSRLNTILPMGNAQNLCVLCGRPLVLARASVKLDLYGEPAHSLAYDDFGKRKTFGFENVQFQTLFGDVNRVYDGLIGYFADSSGSNTLYPAHGTPPPSKASGYVDYEKRLTLSAQSAPEKLTLLLDPEAEVSIRAGVLPSVNIKIPPHFVQEALERMNMAFEINPVLSEQAEIAMPLPREDELDWSWTSRTKDGYTNSPITQPVALFGEQRTSLVDGYLMSSHKVKDKQ